MKYLSLFTGIGGFELGIGPKHKCVGYSEIDKYATQIYKHHYPTHTNYGDITKIKEKSLPDFDLLVGGFPCQSFSIAGKRKGFDDTRGTLFFDIARIVRQKRPRLLLLENVKGLLSHEGGRTFGVIIGTLDELGYDCQWQVLNSKDHGVPQNRERIFIVGHLRGTSRPKVFPFGIPTADDTRSDASKKEVLAGTLTARQFANGGGNYVQIGTLRTHKDGQGFRQIKSGLSPTIPARARQDGSGQPVIRQSDSYIRETTDGYHLARNDKKHSSIQGTHVTYPKGKTHALSTAHKPMTIKNGDIRRLTPIECERLQGFPDNWTDCVSDTQRYKCLGNAVTVNVIRDICARLLRS